MRDFGSHRMNMSHEHATLPSLRNEFSLIVLVLVHPRSFLSRQARRWNQRLPLFVHIYACTCALCAEVGNYMQVSNEELGGYKQASLLILAPVLKTPIYRFTEGSNLRVLRYVVPRH